jgi:EAL domain-containing protein (putative c-di-GMP-specific phosphodiesterase class I)
MKRDHFADMAAFSAGEPLGLGGRLINYYQPIVDLQSGLVLGVEILARLQRGAAIIPPGMFLPNFGDEALETLLFASLSQGMQLLRGCAASHPHLFLSVNVSPRTMLRDGFVDTVLHVLDQAAIAPQRLTLEILENDEFLSLPAARAVLGALGSHGISMALDDVGSGYSSLNRLRELPMVSKIKLDQSFVRCIESEPSGLNFVASMLGLARSLHDELFVEGVETPSILHALTVLGVQGAQGFAIARPQPADAMLDWLAAWRVVPGSNEPTSLLGAYAAHLKIVEACRGLMHQPLKFQWLDEARDPHACSIGRFFDAEGLHDTDFGAAHKRFHQVIDQYHVNRDAWEEASADLWRGLRSAIQSGHRRETGNPAVVPLNSVPVSPGGRTGAPCPCLPEPLPDERISKACL